VAGRRNFDFSVCVSPPLLFRPEADYQLSIIFAARSGREELGDPHDENFAWWIEIAAWVDRGPAAARVDLGPHGSAVME
jgi:hypothetical protein